MHRHDGIEPRAVGREDVVRIDGLEGGHRLGHHLLGGRRQVKAAHHRVDLLDARDLLHLPDGVDDPGMATGGDDDEPAVLHEEGGRVLTLEVVGHQVTGPGLHLHHAEVGRRARRVDIPRSQPGRRGGLLEVGQPRDLPRRERLPGDHRGLAGEVDLQALGLERRAVELALVDGRGGRHDDAMAEGVLAARVDRHPRLPLALAGRGQRRQGTIVIHVPVAQHECVGRVGIDAERAVVVEQAPVGEAEVQQDLPALPAP